MDSKYWAERIDELQSQLHQIDHQIEECPDGGLYAGDAVTIDLMLKATAIKGQLTEAEKSLRAIGYSWEK